VTNSVYYGNLEASKFADSVESLAGNISRLMDLKVRYLRFEVSAVRC